MPADQTDPGAERHERRERSAQVVSGVSLAGGATSAGAILWLLMQMQQQVGTMGSQLAVVASTMTQVQASIATEAAREEAWRNQTSERLHGLDMRTTVLEQRSAPSTPRR